MTSSGNYSLAGVKRPFALLSSHAHRRAEEGEELTMGMRAGERAHSVISGANVDLCSLPGARGRRWMRRRFGGREGRARVERAEAEAEDERAVETSASRPGTWFESCGRGGGGGG